MYRKAERKKDTFTHVAYKRNETEPDCYLEEYTPSEEEIADELKKKMVFVIEPHTQNSYFKTDLFSLNDIAKAIVNLMKGE